MKMSLLQTLLLISTLSYLRVEGVCRATRLNEMEQLVLDKHNEYRARHHGTPPLCYARVAGQDITFAAQEWVEHIRVTGEFEHTPDPKAFGENMSWASYNGEDPEPAPFYNGGIERWYNEIKNWDFVNSRSNGVTSHFTQLVWKDATQLNCGFATSETLHRAYVVCQYWPKGNWMDQFPDQVQPLKGSTHSIDDGEIEEEVLEEEVKEDVELEEDVEEEVEENVEDDVREGSEEISDDSGSDRINENDSEDRSDSENVIFEGPENLVFGTDSSDVGSNIFKTCDCWTPECRYCSDISCTVKQDLPNSEQGIAVRSIVKRKKYNSVVFYDENGSRIGKFQWSKRGIFLTGCIACVTPKALKGKCIKNVQTLWVVSIYNGVLQIKIDGEILYENRLMGECLEKYSKTKRFAFYGMPEESSYSFVADQMEAGEKIFSTGCA